MEIQRTAVEAGVVVESFELDLCGNVRMTGRIPALRQSQVRSDRYAEPRITPCVTYPLQRMGDLF
jgi:hypothetical protein